MASGNLFWNRCSNENLQKKIGEKGPYYIVRFPLKRSADGYGSFTMYEGQVLKCTNRDGSVVAGYSNILLGNPDTVRKVSIKTADGRFAKIEMTNRAIYDVVSG